MNEEAFCAECKEDFPVEVGGRPTMGALRPLAEYGQRWQERYSSWMDPPEGAYLCGNCYFDLTDD